MQRRRFLDIVVRRRLRRIGQTRSPVPGTKSLSLNRNSHGDSTGGNADDAAAVRANDSIGLATLPTR
jgi:hypothetical protein